MTKPMGEWEDSFDNALSIVGVHAVVLHTGKVLYWCFDSRAVGLLGKDNDQFVSLFNNPTLGSYQIWDPALPAQAEPVEAIGRNSFCAGQCALADGTILVAGGQDGAGAIENYDFLGSNYFDPNFWSSWLSSVSGTDNGALRDLQTFDPIAHAWTRWPDLQDGRYYPTCLTLGDGTAFIAGGLSNLQQWVASGSNWAENDQFETVPPGEFWHGTTPQQKFRSADQYPIICLLPGSYTLFVHIETQTSLFDLDSSSFIDGAVFMPPGVGRQTYPMQTGHVLLPQKQGDAPRIMIVGGSTSNNFDFNTQSDKPAVRGAFVFEFNPAAPLNSRWRATKGTPNVARLMADTVLLPDGTVFVVNGYSGGAAAGHTDRFGPVMEAEIFDPATEIFTLVEPNPRADHPRGYHSTAVLLPDARVAMAGNTDAYNPDEPNQHDDVSIQIYDPPYLFAGPRPVVTGVQEEIPYGSSVVVDTSGGPPVAKVTMMRPCAVTHSVDMDQRAILLKTTGGAGTITIEFPTDKTLAPPGYYMLFFLSAAGVPSTASFVRIFDAAPTYPPINLGTYSGSGFMAIEESFDGDITLEKIDNGARVTLESRHGSITINDRISDQGTYANLKAATTVSIGKKIDQGAQVEILAGGDVAIGQTIDQHSSAMITSTSGKIDIGLKVDAHSSATLIAGTTVHIGQTVDAYSKVKIVAQGEVSIDEMLDQHTTSDITSVHGAIRIGQSVNAWANATLTAQSGVQINQKVDQHSIATITAQGDVQINQKIDQHSIATINSAQGSINIGQGLSGEATATVTAPHGDINIGDSVDGGSTLNWTAQQLNCPHQDGTINHIP
ncbi:galactose oxidase-like domain-containing protein [Kitasatospora sp. NPDC101157]|uniref:galactose oxidase-like domain-containing protein n=1 Tax=Kitasatospora sp. NPDC101157 TaxID=3364098 RepID=UPI00382E1C56